MMDITQELAALKKNKNAVILAHYYQDSEIQDSADFLGDSLALAQAAKETSADIIVFAGVHFMAETAKILNPLKKVLLPDLNAGCSLADSCDAAQFQAFILANPGHVVVSYINCTAEVKALSDILCTSSNAERVIHSIPEDKPIIFAPDRHLGRYLQKKTGREMLLWEGSCVVHETFDLRRLIQLQARHPGAEIIAHPECPENILDIADFIGSTTALLQYTLSSTAQSFIVVTESGILHQMQKASPQKDFIPAQPLNGCLCNECPYMKMNTLEKLYNCLLNETPEIIMDGKLTQRARLPLERMLNVRK